MKPLVKWRLVRDECGGLALYSAALLAFTIGLGSVIVDLGRVVVLRGQMQNYADAAALAAALQLDGRSGARDRAREMASEAFAAYSGMVDGDPRLAIADVRFYQSFETGIPAENDAQALAVEVEVSPREIRFFFMSILDSVAGRSSAASMTMSARAGAKPQPYICHAPPLMLCDLSEIDPALDLRAPAHAGRQVRLKEPQAGNSPLAPGNFGLLALPDGSMGANTIEAALAAVEPADCYSLDLTTAPGSQTQKVRSGMNARFDLAGGWPHPAPNVINYPRDDTLNADATAILGNGDWDRNGYWTAKHGQPLPTVLDGASRYQVYLYELGERFARLGRQTLYPAPDALPDGYTLVEPPGRDVPTATGSLRGNRDHDGEPSRAVASNGPRRRLLTVPLLQCIADDVHGSGTYPSGGRFIEVFVTEEVRAPPEAAIYGEVVRGLVPSNYPDFHANVRLTH